MVRGSLEETKKELKLKEKERSQTLEENKQLKESLKNVRLPRQNMQAQLENVKQNMKKVIHEYEGKIIKAKQDLTIIYHEALKQEQTKLQEKEHIIRSLFENGKVWMERFAAILRGGQHLPLLLARAEAMADVFSTPIEIYQLFEYCEDMIDLMREIISHR